VSLHNDLTTFWRKCASKRLLNIDFIERCAMPFDKELSVFRWKFLSGTSINCMNYSGLKVAAGSSETSVTLNQQKQRNITENLNLRQHR
jgi:hypothetical protein